MKLGHGKWQILLVALLMQHCPISGRNLMRIQLNNNKINYSPFFFLPFLLEKQLINYFIIQQEIKNKNENEKLGFV